MSKKQDNTGWKIVGGLAIVVTVLHLLDQRKRSVISSGVIPAADTPVMHPTTTGFPYNGKPV